MDNADKRFIRVGLTLITLLLLCACGLALAAGAMPLLPATPLRRGPTPTLATLLDAVAATSVPLSTPSLPPAPTASPTPPLTPTSEPTATAILTPTVTSTSAPAVVPVAPTPTPAARVFSGTGQQVVGPFILNPGLVIITTTHQGSGNLAIEMLDSQGNRVDSLVNQIGPSETSKALQVDGGNYVLNVSAGENWSVSLLQPLLITGLPGPPHTLTGRGQQASRFFQLNQGEATFKMIHTGQENFTFVLLNQNGQIVELLVSGRGPFDGSRNVQISQPGAYLLNVAAGGDWTVTISQ